MLHSLAARAYIMVGEGAGMLDAIFWVTRHIDDNLRGYYFYRVSKLLLAEGVHL